LKMFRKLSQKKLAAAVIVFLGVFAISFIFNKDTAKAPSPVSSTSCLNVGGRCIELERLETNQKRLKGLSDREYLAANTGVLFVYDSPASECIWMKDMRFSIDTIWLNESKTIKKIERNVSPATYPATFCQDETMYVIELNAGDVKKAGLQVGQKLSF
jgi:uncharacterized membrane protein (UPF0127 family)